jgi:hypothetical protein
MVSISVHFDAENMQANATPVDTQCETATGTGLKSRKERTWPPLDVGRAGMAGAARGDDSMLVFRGKHPMPIAAETRLVRDEMDAYEQEVGR